MYAFAIVALLALATLKVADFLIDNIPGTERFRSVVVFVLGVGSVVWLDLSLFASWGIDIREDYLGVWLTGFIVAGMTVPWRAAFRFVTHDSAAGDESLGEHGGFLRKAA